jgi:hypothetical protein
VPPDTGIRHYSALIATIPRIDRQEWSAGPPYLEPVEGHS